MIAAKLSLRLEHLEPALKNHLWQSTIFVLVVALLALALRKNHARTRYWLWLTASVKFLLPFSLLVSVGSLIPARHKLITTQPAVLHLIDEVGRPFTPQPTTAVYAPAIASPAYAVPGRTPPNQRYLLATCLTSVWLAGFFVVLTVWWTYWRRIRAAMRDAVPLREGREIEALRRLEGIGAVRTPIQLLLSESSLGPGVYGSRRPTLIWPVGISNRLDEPSLESIIAHEVCHVRHRDNLTATFHMVVEAVFWFHPLVWWLGSRLEQERERACDEEVLQVCDQPQAYAESILTICEFYLESPLPCVSGVTGADLKKRIQHIISGHVVKRLDFSKRLLLLVAGLLILAIPVVAGALKVSPTLKESVKTVTSAMAAAVEPLVTNPAPMKDAVLEPPVRVQMAPVPLPDATAHSPTDITGMWQGTLHTPRQGDLRLVVKIVKTDNNNLEVIHYSIDQGGQPMTAFAAALQGSAFSYSIPSINSNYQGQLSDDGNTIAGNWTQGSSLPLVFERATKERAWKIPVPLPPPMPMATDVDPTFKAAIITPSDPSQGGRYFHAGPSTFTTHGTSLASLIEFAYGVNAKQIVNGPDWLDKDTYDITAVADHQGRPSESQERTMFQKLLADRFKLALHHEMRDLPAYTLTMLKDGPKNLVKNENKNPLPSMFFQPAPGGTLLPVRNATMADFIAPLQEIVDRPIIDQTGLSGRFDFKLTWKSNSVEPIAQSFPKRPNDTSLPDVFAALQEEIGLKLNPVTVPLDVLVLDHVEHPSGN